MDDSLEALLEKATNPKNKYEDWEFIMAFCDRVNADPDGPPVALRIIAPKLRNENEKVALLTLTLLEACVKNCGRRLHQELGKFRFLNEMIKLLSPKYYGQQTPPKVQDKVKELLYSWKMGLPHEPKIAEAYEMLKKEGLVFDETKPADPTLQAPEPKPKVALAEDPKQSRMLQKLLASKNPEDLRAANRLIREMVRRDEKRMERLKKRLDELELVQNNIRLLGELLAHFKPDSGSEDEKSLIRELHLSLEKMRPNLFRMASELKQNEEGMSEILQTNEDLTRVMDQYKKAFGEEKKDGEDGGGATSSTPSLETPVTSGASTTSSSVTDAKTTGAGATGAATSDGDDLANDILIDLADLNFGSSGPAQNSVPTTSSGSLLDDLGLLGVFPPGSTTQGFAPLTMPPPLATPPTQPAPTALPTQQLLLSSSSNHTPPLITLPPPPGGTTVMPVSRTSPKATPPPSHHPTPQQPAVSPSTSSAATMAKLLGDLGSLSLVTPPSTAGGSPTPVLGGPVPTIPPPGLVGGQALNVQSDPLAVLNDLFVPLESIQTGIAPALQVMNKNSVSASLYIAQNPPVPGVSVFVLSIISTNPMAISNLQFQAAVPKVMRVKLQPPTGTSLASYRPILPPPSISQVLLLANPTKAKIRLKYRLSYEQGGQEVVEVGEASDFPAS